jgi:hypothetical protein
MALIAGVGCSSLPTGPSPEVGPAAGAGTAGTAAAIRQPVAFQPLTSSKRIYGTFGGTVTAGNFTVVIPPLAVSGSPTVKVTQPDPAKPYVQLEILPSSANKFRVPVTLVVNAGPMSAEKLSVAYISWYNPSTRTWEKMRATEVNLLNRTVSCPLSHFSEYAVQVDGKAGW